MTGRNSRIPPCLAARLRFAAVIVLLSLPACAGGNDPSPLSHLPPPLEGPPPTYPSIAPPPDNRGRTDPVLTEAERAQLEERLSKFPAEREAAVKRRILRGKRSGESSK